MRVFKINTQLNLANLKGQSQQTSINLDLQQIKEKVNRKMPGDTERKTGEEGTKCNTNNQGNAQEANNKQEQTTFETKSKNKESLKEFARASIKIKEGSSGQSLELPEFNEKQQAKGTADPSAQKQHSSTDGLCQKNETETSAKKIQPNKSRPKKAPIYGALDLGTNNCRLLLARPNRQGFQIVDAFSRIIRLGEGVSETNILSKDAMARTIDALQVCSAKLAFHKVNRARLVATQACRAAGNSDYFLNEVADKTGLELEIICQETEAKLAVSGCVPLIDTTCDYALIFDIGGGSSELIWIDIQKLQTGPDHHFINVEDAIVSWISLPVGVVTLAEKFGGKHVDKDVFAKMIAYVKLLLEGFASHIKETTNITKSNIHYLGTSGTVTTLAGVHLCLESYDRQKIDGIWMHTNEVTNVSKRLMDLNFEERSAIPSIGRERADLVMGGCAILEAMLETWPTDQLRVADRGLREGILAKLMAEDGFIKPGQSWTSQPKKSVQRRGRAKNSARHAKQSRQANQSKKTRKK